MAISFRIVFKLLVVLSIFFTSASAQLKVGFYKDVCPNVDVEKVVFQTITRKFRQTSVTAPAVLRLFFHDCAVEGCDASVMIASTGGNQAEKDSADDITLAGDGFDAIIRAKAAIDKFPECRNKVSCADILAMATRDVVALTGGPKYQVELGRRDGTVSQASRVPGHLPQPEFNLNQLIASYTALGLSITDIVALSGSHTIGVSHCNRFSSRIRNFSPTSFIDPTLDATYAAQLRDDCPVGVDPSIVVPMDPFTPDKFDNLYFQGLVQGKGMFTSDESLFTDSRTRNTVKVFARYNSKFQSAFVEAVTKLGRVGVKTGSQGEIRINCGQVN